MRLISFLNEKVIKNIELSKDEAYDLLNTKCPNNLNSYRSGKRLYRGDPSITSKYIHLPKKGRNIRKSANTQNFYTLLLSKYLDSWKQYPKRNLGVICTTSINKAEMYTKNKGYFSVIPFDNIPIGVCPADDIWDSFKKLNDYGIFNLNGFNKMLNSYGIKTNNFEQELNKPLSLDSPLWVLYYYVKKPLPKMLGYDLGSMYPKDLKLDGKTTLKDILNDVFNPDKNRFKLIKSLNELPTGYFECWFDGDAILINNP